MPPPVLFWFRRDLRLADQPALAEAAGQGPVVPVFVIDPALQRPAGAARLAFLSGCLAALDDALGGRLVVRAGVPSAVLAAVADETGAVAVHATADFGPYGRRRDERVRRDLADHDVEVRYRGAPYAVAPGTLRTAGGQGFKVFSAFRRAWEGHGWEPPGPAVEADWVGGVRSDGVPPAPPVGADLPAAGEVAAWERAEAFLAGPVHEYHERRSQPGVEGTSRLSPDLKWGVLHPRQLLDRLGGSKGEATYRAELAWRDFYADVLFHRPETAREAFVASMAGLRRDEGPTADDRFRAWADGRTGYPVVDAGMRQLRAEGWMHNRVRMVTASFLVKDLHVDWTRGARWFMEHLVDGDLASNQHGWQWVAGTGTDAAPFYRVFNPVTQGERFDPDGRYVRRWVPELADVADEHVHAPWTAPGGPPAGYPPPLVDHGEQRREALARYEEVRRRA